MQYSTEQLNSLNPQLTDIGEFQTLCNNYINSYYSIYDLIKGEDSLPVSAFRRLDSSLFKILPFNKIELTANLINNDLSLLSRSKPLFKKVFYFSPSDALSKPYTLRKLRSLIKNYKVDYEILPYSKIIAYLRSNTNFNNIEQLKNSDLNNLYKINHFPSRFVTITDEIFEYVNSPNYVIKKSESYKSRLEHLTQKININFSIYEQNKVHACFRNLWRQKELVETYIHSHIKINTHKIFSLLDKVQTEFLPLNRKLKIEGAVNYASNMKRLADTIIPPGKKDLIEYEECAKAIILYFFEMCDFGKKYEGEELSFLQKFKDEYDPPE